jgi:hypothetical protein
MSARLYFISSIDQGDILDKTTTSNPRGIDIECAKDEQK